jgi:DNA replication and repair protein RecF
LALRDFRNYARLELAADRRAARSCSSARTGPARRTCSRRSRCWPLAGAAARALAELERTEGGPWRVEARVEARDGPTDLATSPVPGGEGDRRQVRRDGTVLRSQNELAEILSMVWLTPVMDRLFAEGASARRRFLDRLVLAIDPKHAGRVSTYERLLRERSHLLREPGRRDPAWLGALERRIAEAGVAVAAARNELVRDLGRALAEATLPFPRPRLAVEGEVEGWLASMPALDAEQRLAGALAQGRRVDAETAGRRWGRTGATSWPPTPPRASPRRAARPGGRRRSWSASCWPRRACAAAASATCRCCCSTR